MGHAGKAKAELAIGLDGCRVRQVGCEARFVKTHARRLAAAGSGSGVLSSAAARVVPTPR